MSDNLKLLVSRVHAFNMENCTEVPSVAEVHGWLDRLVDNLFPIRQNVFSKPEVLEQDLAKRAAELTSIVERVCPEANGKRQDVSKHFMERLPEVFQNLTSDAQAISRLDPASECVEEVLPSYPGFYAICTYRLAHELYGIEVPLIPRVMAEYAHGKTGIDIHPGAQIGTPFFIDHGTGIVVGETTVIGKNVRLYQGVTLGALSVEKSMAKSKRHPTIGDNVVIYAGSTILGGKTVIGHDTVVGGNTWIIESVLPHSVVYRNHRVVVRDSRDYEAPLDYVI